MEGGEYERAECTPYSSCLLLTQNTSSHLLLPLHPALLLPASLTKSTHSVCFLYPKYLSSSASLTNITPSACFPASLTNITPSACFPYTQHSFNLLPLPKIPLLFCFPYQQHSFCLLSLPTVLILSASLTPSTPSACSPYQQHSFVCQPF
ncbi:hypothetical protein Pcinc_043674 [Petrolisthes cinctipes]|uniref:Uncharacterized protein n=1 Tax=Petrolisthes cinctipes TaxID=88211 RepID=A0AAE1BF61_PETCI|nr:hypothetical protein Pcinc_043674 [Petrolisthes cinctipes]